MKKIVVIVTYLLFVTFASGQIKGSYSFGGIVIPGANNTTFSGPLSFAGDNECLTLQNGVSLYISSDAKRGIFTMSCRIDNSNGLKTVNIYPNPADAYTIIQSNQFALGADRIEIYIMDVRGNVVFHELYKADLLKLGLRLPTRNLAGGLYLLKLVSNSNIQSFKIIKNGTPK